MGPIARPVLFEFCGEEHALTIDGARRLTLVLERAIAKAEREEEDRVRAQLAAMPTLPPTQPQVEAETLPALPGVDSTPSVAVTIPSPAIETDRASEVPSGPPSETPCTQR